MKFLLVLAGVLCVALIVSARPTDEEAEAESSTEGSELDGTDSDAPVGDTEGEDDTAAAGDGSETGEGTGEDGTEGSDDGTEGDEGTEGGEGTEGEDGAAEGDDAETEDAGKGEGGAEGGDDAEGGAGGEGGEGGEGGAKETARNTYRQVHKLLKKIMKVDMKDKYLKSYVVGRLQERLMNPTIDLVNTIEKYSKIKSCFNSLEKDVKGLVKESEKSYAECKKENSNGDCGNEGTRELDEGLIDREQELADCIVDKRDAD